MAYTTIDDPTIFFKTQLRNGLNGGSDTAFDIGFQPDWIWDKSRSTTGVQALYDSVRGFGSSGKVIYADSGNVEATNALIKSVSSTGYTIEESADHSSSVTIVDWCWKAGTSFSNSAGYNGADLASSGSYNRTCGFSIVTFTGNATADQQVYHGLNSVPKWMLLKNRTNSNAESWCVYHADVGNTKKLTLDTTATPSTDVEFWQNTTPTSTVFTVGRQDAVNGSGNTHVVYCFSEVQGYSKFGTYRGTSSSTDGSYTWLGFKPAWVMMKRTDSADWWGIHDNGRSTFNPNAPHLEADSTGAEGDGPEMDFLSNGFKMRNTNAGMNNSSGTYVYMAFAESPFVNSNGIPNNAE